MRSGLISHPDKVLFAERGETKGDLAEHYLRAQEPLMRAMGGRPVLLQRFPEGAGGQSFFQKRVPRNAPDWLQTTTVTTPNGTTSQALVAADLDHVLWAVNLGCLGFHVWPYLAADPDHADELRIDLDPGAGTDFTQIRQAAGELRLLLDELGLAGYPKTTGNRGLHVYVRLQPRWDSYQVRAAAVAAARELERRRPDLITAAWWKEERGERVFVDYNQNAHRAAAAPLRMPRGLRHLRHCPWRPWAASRIDRISAASGLRGVLASTSSSSASAAIWPKSAALMPKSAIACVMPTWPAMLVIAVMAAPAFQPAVLAGWPAPRATATSASRSVQTGALNSRTCGRTMLSATPCGMSNRAPIACPIAWQMPSPVPAIAMPAMCAASSICALASRSAPSAQACGRFAAIMRMTCNAMPSDQGLARIDR